jgi:hypothetical protein
MKLWIKPFSFSSKRTKRFAKQPYFHQGDNTTMAKTKKEKKVKQAHPFGPPEAGAKGFVFESPNPTLHVYSGKSVSALPANLQAVFEAIAKHNSHGVSLKDLKVPKLGAKTLNWLVRQLCKHSYVRAEAEPKKPAKAVKP